MCDDVEATIAELTAQGVEFEGPVSDRGWGTRSECQGGVIRAVALR